MTFRPLLTATLFAVAAPVANTQEVTPADSSSEPIRVFVDCDFCDDDYLRVETPWVAFVRDRTASDVYLLLTRLQTGGGGNHYTLLSLGHGTYATRRDTVVFETPPRATDDARRVEIVRNIQLALVPYAVHTPSGRALKVLSVAQLTGDEDAGIVDDPWDAWVFEIGGDAEAGAEQSQSDVQFSGNFSARRITSQLKLGLSADADFDRSRFQLDDDEGMVASTSEEYRGGVVAVASLGEHWGAGAEATASSSTYENTRLAIRAAPAIEYSLFPYDEATRRQIVFQYSVGVSVFQYREETILDRIREVRPSHAVVFGYDARQPWGSASATLEASAYLDNSTQNRLDIDVDWEIRLMQGLELEVGGSAALIHDQISIPKRGATADEILLQRRALGTDYRYNTRIGLNFTFGSIFNSVVNPRFGTGPGDIIH